MARSVALPSGSSQRVNTDEGQNLRRLFTKDGVALRFWFDGNIPHTHVERLTTLITKHGGVVRSTEAGSDVIIVSENYRHIYDQAYWSYPDVYVELPSFIQDCIERKKCEHMAPIRKGMGGQPKPRRPRTEFTAEDRRHLCDYLARVIPDKADGGRTGNIIYQRLVASAEGRGEDHINAWAKRHTWQSWREHYKKNQLELDPIIDEIAPRYPPQHRGQYELSRRAGPRKRVHHEVFDDEEEEEEEPAGSRSRRSVSPQQSGSGAPLYEKEEEEEEDQDQQDEDQDEYQQEIHGGKDLETDEDEDEGEEDGDQRILRDLLAFDEDDQIPETSDDDPIWKAERRRPDQDDDDSMGEDEEDSDAEHPPPVYSDRDPQSVSDKLARNRRKRTAVAASSPTRFAPSQATLVNTTQSGRTQASNGQSDSNIIPEDLEPPPVA
ncbi:hypothetical protein QCA50_017305 [Cerrena zonata]|uniref:DNA-binding protein RAP1 n=1 Tax=Cerrena zonata TaxID=2478898 RepID=A0AAW0FKY0_9APHY